MQDSGDSHDPHATLAQAVPGQVVLGRYRLDKILGRGGFGVVWLARDKELEMDVAIKFLSELIVNNPEAIDDLKRETRFSLKLTHPNIVRIYGFIQGAGFAGVSMEYVDGGTLSALKVQRPDRCFDVDTLAPLVEKLCDALYYAHTKVKIAHRDMKPGNLMVDSHGELKVADFGISRSIADTQTALTRMSTSGTPAFMSPQQLMGEPTRVTDDIYSVGATLFDLLAGKPPFYQGDVVEQLRSVRPPSIQQRRQELGIQGDPVPREWEETIAACLEKDADRRPQNAAEVAARLGLRAPAMRAATPLGVATEQGVVEPTSGRSTPPDNRLETPQGTVRMPAGAASGAGPGADPGATSAIGGAGQFGVSPGVGGAQAGSEIASSGAVNDARAASASRPSGGVAPGDRSDARFAQPDGRGSGDSASPGERHAQGGVGGAERGTTSAEREKRNAGKEERGSSRKLILAGGGLAVVVAAIFVVMQLTRGSSNAPAGGDPSGLRANSGESGGRESNDPLDGSRLDSVDGASGQGDGDTSPSASSTASRIRAIESALAVSDYDGAERELGELRTQIPGDSRLVTLAEQIELGRDVFELRRQINRQLSDGDFQAANASIGRLLRIRPDDREARAWQREVAEKLGQPSGAGARTDGSEATTEAADRGSRDPSAGDRTGASQSGTSSGSGDVPSSRQTDDRAATDAGEGSSRDGSGKRNGTESSGSEGTVSSNDSAPPGGTSTPVGGEASTKQAIGTIVSSYHRTLQDLDIDRFAALWLDPGKTKNEFGRAFRDVKSQSIELVEAPRIELSGVEAVVRLRDHRRQVMQVGPTFENEFEVLMRLREVSGVWKIEKVELRARS